MKEGHTKLSHHQICLNSDSNKDTVKTVFGKEM